MAKKKPIFGAIVLAAGQSKRFKANKFLANVNGQPLLQRTLTPFIELTPRVKTICVVTGAYNDDLQPLIQKLRVNQIYNPEYSSTGMSSSVKRGLVCLQDELNEFMGIFIHPGDIPFILAVDLQQMMATQEQNSSKIVIPTFKAQRGHPLLIHSSLANELSTLEEKRQGLRGFLIDHSEEIEFVNTNNPGILCDIDYPEDLQRIDF